MFPPGKRDLLPLFVSDFYEISTDHGKSGLGIENYWTVKRVYWKKKWESLQAYFSFSRNLVVWSRHTSRKQMLQLIMYRNVERFKVKQFVSFNDFISPHYLKISHDLVSGTSTILWETLDEAFCPLSFPPPLLCPMDQISNWCSYMPHAWQDIGYI